MKIGDIFSVPIAENKLGYGQIAERYQKVLFYCVFFSRLLTNELKCVSLLAGITTDARIKSGDWKVISNQTSTLKEIFQPRYKVMMGGSFYVEDLLEKARRKIEKEEADILPFRNIVAPVRYEKALCAHFGVGELEQPYDRLLYENVVRSQEIALK